MLENRKKFEMGYSFFKELTEDTNIQKNHLEIPELPEAVDNILMRKTTISDAVIYDNQEKL